MKRPLILFLFVAFVAAGCARTWVFEPIDTYRPSGNLPPSSVCRTCHEGQFNAWQKNRHSKEKYMARIPTAGTVPLAALQRAG